jgi:hypothetical protein
MKTVYEVRSMKDNRAIKSFDTTKEAENWLRKTYPDINERMKYYVSLPIRVVTSLEELFDNYYGKHEPSIEKGWEDLSEDLIDEYEDAYEELAQEDEEVELVEDKPKTIEDIFIKYKSTFDTLAKEFLVLLAIKNKGVWEDIYDDLMNNVDVYNHVRSDAILFDLYHSDIKTVTIFEDEYPAILKKSYKPPFVLFYTGDLKLAEKAIDSSGILGQELLADVIIKEGFPITLVGKEQILIKHKDNSLFVSTTFGGEMTDREKARLFLQLSKDIYFDNVPERKLITLVMLYAEKFGLKIMSKRTEWVKDVAGGNVEFYDFFNGTI